MPVTCCGSVYLLSMHSLPVITLITVADEAAGAEELRTCLNYTINNVLQIKRKT